MVHPLLVARNDRNVRLRLGVLARGKAELGGELFRGVADA
jgi:hypothetical protein